MRVTTTSAIAAVGAVAVLTAAAPLPAQAGPAAKSSDVHQLLAPGTVHNDYFGQSIAVAGDTVAVGAPDHNSQHGAVYVYARKASGWHAMAKPTATLSLPGSGATEFGYFVAMANRTIVVGADTQVVSGIGSGATYVFVEPKTGWHTTNHPTATLTPPDPTSQDSFGEYVAISGSTIVVGAQDHPTGGHSYQGAAYVYTKASTGWKSTNHGAELTASDGTTEDYFGGSVAVAGSTVVVGADAHDVSSVTDAGTAYVFQKPAHGGWKSGTQTAELVAADGAANDYLGEAVAADGATIAVGAPEKSNGSDPLGAVYLFHTPRAGWSPGVHTSSVELTPSQPGTQNFGEGLAVSGPTVAVGATESTVAAIANAGLAYLFGEPKAGWASTSKALVVAEPVPTAQHYFGVVALDDGVLAVSSLQGGSVGQGSAYVVAGPSPALTHVTQSKPKWRAGHHGVSINPKHAPHGGTHFGFTASATATVTLAFTEKKHGHSKARGTVTVTAKAGRNTVYVDGPLGHGHMLKPGRCTVAITASNSYGTSHVTRLHFTVK